MATNSALLGSARPKAGKYIFCGQFLVQQRCKVLFSRLQPAAATRDSKEKEDPALDSNSLQQLAVGFLGGILSASFIFTNPASLEFLPPPVFASTRLTSDETSTIQLFNRNTPSVVFITNLATRRDAFTLNNLEVPQGAGSGFVWDTNGHILTNYHVIRGASEVRITLSGGSDYAATVVGVDEDRDVAVLKIDTKGNAKDAQLLKPLQLGTSSDLQVGQRVFAIGNPFGLDHTLTTGVISGVQREISSGNTGRPIEGIIQTDAAINPGNSGGPLLDSSGSVIGINTAIFSPSGANAGVGFAIPVDLVKNSAEQIVQFGRVVRPIMGISFAPDAAVEQLGVTGVLVLDAREGGPASKAGVHGTTRDEYGRLVLGDIILSVDGKKVKTASDLYRALDKSNIGDSLDVELLRGDKTVHVPIVLEPSTASAFQPLPVVTTPPGGGGP
ncbi:hypothetical protein KSW81_004171 [Nannochloris sp. 'desiccata']|nr:hypothetical protein KSW81_004171 [Chlorella desiccata (nom. nud.)]